jgi:hypothetical protein
MARTASRTPRGSPAVDTAKIREWAKGHGIEVKGRGRVPADVVVLRCRRHNGALDDGTRYPPLCSASRSLRVKRHCTHN